jgi:hypothetical protein
MRHPIRLCTFLLSLGLVSLYAQEKPDRQPGRGADANPPRNAKKEGQGGGRDGPQRPQDAPLDDVRFLFKTDVPPHPFVLLLGRPTANSVTASVVAYDDREGLLEFAPAGGKGASRRKTQPFPLKAGKPAEIVLDGLPPDTSCTYRLLTRRDNSQPWEAAPKATFHTQRKPASPFSFTVQADPHLDYNTEPALYLRCLANARADRPDFHIDLGDTFMTDKHRGRDTAAAQYLAQRFYFSHIAAAAPLFLVLGNHDGEAGRWLDGSPDNLAVWSNQQRKQFYPNPIPGAFYGGNAVPDPHAGILQNYFSWE